MVEQAGTPEDFARLLGGGPKPGHAEMVAAAHPPDPAPIEGDTLSSNQARAANEYGLPNVVAARIRGEDYDEVSADAQAIAAALKKRAEADAPEASNRINAAELAALAQPKRGARAVIDALHPPDEKEAEANE